VKAYKQIHGAERGFRGEGLVGNQQAGAVRLRVPDEGETVVHDAIRGETRFAHLHLDDPVIARADGSVLYNFAVAIDDLDAHITHVVRGEDHLSNTPKQVLVLEAVRAVGFGAEQPLPSYAHLPLLHGPDGKKLSKRHGAASVQELRDAGYLPEAVRNYLALLGWGSGDDATVLTTAELIERFTLERVSRNPARFDEVKLKWLNGVHIRELTVEELTRRLEVFTGREGLGAAVAISQEKLHTLADFWPLSGFLFDGPQDDPAAREKWLGEDGRSVLLDARAALAEVAEFDEAGVRGALEGVLEHRACKPKAIYQPLRVAISGTTISPGIFESVALLGKDETLRRIDGVL
jgi:glutamyl-tRNA synthetase